MSAHYTRVLDSMSVSEALHSGAKGFGYTEVYKAPTKAELTTQCSEKAFNRVKDKQQYGKFCYWSAGIVTPDAFYAWDREMADHAAILTHLNLRPSATVIPLLLQYFPSPLTGGSSLLVVRVADFNYGVMSKVPSATQVEAVLSQCPDLRHLYPVTLVSEYGEEEATLGSSLLATTAFTA